MRIKSSKYIVKTVGDETRKARILGLELTLKDLSEKTGINLKTLSGFENGRSTNIYIFYIYYVLLDSKNRTILIDNILERIE